MSFILACAQMNSTDSVEHNIDAARRHIAEAATKHAKLVALPENAFSMTPHTGTNKPPEFSFSTHPAISAMCEAAKEHAIWILIGSLAVREAGASHFQNRAVLIDASGEVVTHYDKIHLFDMVISDSETYRESARMAAGEKAVLAETPWGKLGLTICYDLRFPHLYRALAEAGAGMIAVPAAFTVFTGEAHWHVLLRARAIENGCYIFAPAQTGTHPGERRTYGHSIIIDPWGRILAELPDGEGVITAEIDMAQVEAVRSRLPSLQHTRPFTF